MIARVLAIFAAHMVEALRAPATYLLILLALLGLPALVLATSGETSVWIARTGASEGLRFGLPLAAITAAGFILRPGVRRGWALLEARRAEWFAGTALAGVVMLLGASALFAGGGALAIAVTGEGLERTQVATALQLERLHEGQRQVAPAREDGLTWANPATGEEFVFGIPALDGDTVEGSLEYRLAWTAQGAPLQRAPVDVYVATARGLTPAAIDPVSQTVLRFSVPVQPGEMRLVVRPIDPVLYVGTSAGQVRFKTGDAAPWVAMLWLTVLGAGAALVLLCAVLAARGYASGPTAILVGLLLLAATTLLPGLAPTDVMARERRAAMHDGDTGGGTASATLLHYVPRLYPDEPFQDLQAGRAPGVDAALAGLTRAGVALLLLVPGAWLFTRREIAR